MKRNKSITGLLLMDAVLLTVFLAAALGMGCLVFSAVLVIVSAAVRAVLTGVFVFAMLALAGSMIWVFLQLFRNRGEVYGEELRHQELLQRRKEEHEYAQR